MGSGNRCPETPESRIISFFGFLPMLITLGPPVIQKIYEPPNDLLLNSFLLNLTRARKRDLCRGEILQNKNYMVSRKGAIRCNTKAFFSQWLKIITNFLLNGEELEITYGTHYFHIQLYVDLIRKISLTLLTNFVIIFITSSVKEDF